MMHLLPEDILCGVFYHCGQGTLNFTTHELHKSFYKLRKNPQTAQLLDDFLFSGSPISPYSEVLASALFNLQFSKKISRANPDLVKYTKTEAFDIYYDNVVKRKLETNPEATGVLQLIADELTSSENV
jgi:hypothetical protein